jgi:hypothetical protein
VNELKQHIKKNPGMETIWVLEQKLPHIEVMIEQSGFLKKELQ